MRPSKGKTFSVILIIIASILVAAGALYATTVVVKGSKFSNGPEPTTGTLSLKVEYAYNPSGNGAENLEYFRQVLNKAATQPGTIADLGGVLQSSEFSSWKTETLPMSTTISGESTGFSTVAVLGADNVCLVGTSTPAGVSAISSAPLTSTGSCLIGGTWNELP